MPPKPKAHKPKIIRRTEDAKIEADKLNQLKKRVKQLITKAAKLHASPANKNKSK